MQVRYSRRRLYGRYLTDREKVDAVADWKRLCEALPDDVPPCGDERGFPDPPIVAWCNEINALPGICTVQSCAGHRRLDGTLISGHLWVRLSRDVSARFDEAALSLAAQPGIEQVSKLFGRWGAELAMITFLGSERDHLERSMRVVLRFLGELATPGRCPLFPSPDTRCRVHQTSASYS
jgi:hypothetical protein